MRGICTVAVLMGLLFWGVHCGKAQDAAESVLMNSSSTTVAQSAKGPARGTANVATGSSVNRASSPYLVARSGPPPDEMNRRDFENNAGKDAGKLLLRSVPTGAEVFINDRLVGRTPLLMLIAPGKYTIDMRGLQQESGHGTVGVMPNETKTVAIDLKQRYPTSISTR